jgi:hypothetical protein
MIMQYRIFIIEKIANKAFVNLKQDVINIIIS